MSFERIIDPVVLKKILDDYTERMKRHDERPRSLTDKLMDVQPLPAPLGLIYYIKYKYGDGK